MVRVIIDGKIDNIALAQINGMKVDELIAKCGKDKSWFGTVGGRRMDGNDDISTFNLIDRSSIRVVQETRKMDPPLSHDFDAKLKTVYEHMKKISRRFLISDYMTDADKMDEIRKKFPEMYSNSHIYTLLNDFYTLQAFFSERTSQKEALIRRNPYIVDVCICLVQNSMSNHRDMMPRPRVAPPPAAIPPPAPLFSAEAITAALRSAMAVNAREGQAIGVDGMAVPPPLPPPAAVSIPPPSPVENDLRQQYRSQLLQLREFGFVEDEMNLHVLMESNGSLDGAIELLIAMRESMEH